VVPKVFKEYNAFIFKDKEEVKGNHSLNDTASHPRRPSNKTQVLITDIRPEPMVLTEMNDFPL